MNNITPLGEQILIQLNLDSSIIRSLDTRKQRVNYRAAINWIKSYLPQLNDPKTQQIKNLLQAFYHLCEADDVERASKLFCIQIAPYINEELHKQLYLWGQYDEFISITLKFIELLKLKSEVDKAVCILKSTCLENLGMIEFTRGNYKESIDYYKQQLEISTRTECFREKASALVGLGQNLKLVGDYTQANKYYLSAEELAIDLSDKKLMMSVKSGLGSIQIYLGQYELAIPYFQTQLKIALDISDHSGKIQSLADLGNAYALIGDHEASVESGLNALKITHLIQNPEGEAKILAHLGFSFYVQHEYRAAISFYRQSLTISRSTGLFLQEAEALEKVGILEGKLATSQDVKQLALEKLNQALAQFRQAGSLSSEARVLLKLAEAYEDLGETDSALKACEEALDIAFDLKFHLYDECINIKERLMNRKSNDKKIDVKKSTTRKFKELNLQDCDWIKNQIDVVLLTATDVELNAVLDELKSYPGKRTQFKMFEGPETYYAGKFGAFKVIVTKCRMGSIGEGSVILATEQAQRIWKPKAIIMVGIAFGKDPTKQKIGDVLVASQIISYEPQRIGEAVQHRGTIPPTNTSLLNRFENVHNWDFPDTNGGSCRHQVGAILSGEKLIDDAEFKTALFKQFPQAIGGEMEGAGLCAASGRVGVAWILVKAICDWADGEKGDNYHQLAAASAVSLVHKVLSQKTVLNSISKIFE
jgi:nucleoside phosphorylase